MIYVSTEPLSRLFAAFAEPFVRVGEWLFTAGPVIVFAVWVIVFWECVSRFIRKAPRE
jgi:hypothetical protein